MKKLPLATALLALAMPASALAAGASHGVVLSVDRAHHVIRLVDSHHRVHDYSYRGRFRGLHAGETLTYRAHGRRITLIERVQPGSGDVKFFARVLRSTRGALVLVLPDGKKLSFSAHQVRRPGHHARLIRAAVPRHHRPRRVIAHMAGVARAADTAAPVTVNIQGLQPGVTVLVTENVDGSGAVTITITLPPPSVTAGQQANGVVVDVGEDAFMLQTADGSQLRLHMAQSALQAQNLSDCDTVNVTFHQDNNLLIVDSLQITGSSSSGDCAGGDGGGGDNSTDTIGTITAVSGSGLTISADQGTMTFIVDDPSITDGFQVGDVVDVSYSQASDGTLDASDVEYSEQDVAGTVTAVSDSSLTLSDQSGHSWTFSGDPTQGVFDGVSVGDQVDVTYHQSAGQQVADVVDDQSSDGGGDS
jgi:hypothetical protein